MYSDIGIPHFQPEDGGSTLLRNVGHCVPKETTRRSASGQHTTKSLTKLIRTTQHAVSGSHEHAARICAVVIDTMAINTARDLCHRPVTTVEAPDRCKTIDRSGVCNLIADLPTRTAESSRITTLKTEGVNRPKQLSGNSDYATAWTIQGSISGRDIFSSDGGKAVGQ